MGVPSLEGAVPGVCVCVYVGVCGCVHGRT